MQNESSITEECLAPELMVAFVAGELGGEELRTVTSHLESCPICADEVAGLKDIISLLKADSAEVECDVADAVMASIAADHGKTAKKGQLIHLVFGMAKIAALLMVALMLGIMVRGSFDAKGTSDGSAQGEQNTIAVHDAAEWLISVQDEDGSWNPEQWGGRKELGASLTGLAMLTLLSSDVRADDALLEAEEYLISIQNEDGSFGPQCAGRMYNHGIASKALLALRQSGGGTANTSVNSALEYILKAQSPMGGWNYRAADSRNSSIGISVWQLDALMLGHAAGLDGLDDGLRKGLAWLKGTYDGTADFNYSQGAGRPEMSPTVKAMGAMCMLSAEKQVLGILDTEEIQDVLAGAVSDGLEEDLYRSYFVTSAVRAGGRQDMLQRAEGLQADIAQRRIMDGSNAGSWNADGRWGDVGGRVYSTSMAALSLSKR